MSIFQTLFEKKQDKSLENYFTEIVAHLLQNDRDLLFAWVREIENRLKLENTEYTSGQVLTQQCIAGKYADLWIDLRANSRWDVIQIESKINSGEHHDQLKSYAANLATDFSNAGRRILVYITRFYDPKDPEEILAQAQGQVQFIQMRWHEFYYFLKKERPVDTLAQQVVLWMEECGMAHSNQFTVSNLSTMKDLLNLYSLMDASLNGDVRARLGEVLGLKLSPAPVLSHEYNCYTLCNKYDDNILLYCAVGFSLGSSIQEPFVEIDLQINPTRKEYGKFQPALESLVNQYGWEKWQWYDDQNAIEEGEWISIGMKKRLSDLVLEESNLNAIIQWFLNRLAEIEVVKKAYSKIPWEK